MAKQLKGKRYLNTKNNIIVDFTDSEFKELKDKSFYKLIVGNKKKAEATVEQEKGGDKK